jgi:glycerol-3-phosphate dehydrogenase
MKRQIDALRNQSFDLLVLGGGITGAGVALDAVLRGYRVALIDKGDFASGTSSVSSKLVHGGLRYLEHSEFRLVYEALHERRNLLHNAPHLVRPLRFIIPVYQGSRVPGWKWRVGLGLYDLLAGRANLQRSRSLAQSALDREFPDLKQEGLRSGTSYFDAQMDDARLCLEVVMTASEQGACVANYAEAVAFEKHAGEITGVRILDRVGGGEFLVRARQVLNATGPWVDAICRLAGDQSSKRLSPTKGVHVIVGSRGFSSAFLLLHPADGRVFFVIPWMGKTLIGTTDTHSIELPENLSVTASEIDYLLDGHNHYFRTGLDRTAVLGSFAGLRPLVASDIDQPGAISREYQIFFSATGLVTVAGGKYTTYRRMAEVVTDKLAQRLGVRGRCRTKDFRLTGAPLETGDQVSERWKSIEGEGTAGRHLWARYGRHADEVLALLLDPTLARPIVPGEPDILAELPYQRENEMAIYPADHLLRRLRLGLYHPELLKTPLGLDQISCPAERAR